MLSRSSARRDVTNQLTRIANPTFSSKPQYLQQAPTQFDDDGKAAGPSPYAHLLGGTDGGSKVMTQSELLKASRLMSYSPPVQRIGGGASSRSSAALQIVGRRAAAAAALPSPSAPPRLEGGGGGVTAAASPMSSVSEDASDSLWDILEGKSAAERRRQREEEAEGENLFSDVVIPDDADVSQSSGSSAPMQGFPRVARGRVVSPHDEANAAADLEALMADGVGHDEGLVTSSGAGSSSTCDASSLAVGAQRDGANSSGVSHYDPNQQKSFTSNSQYVQQLLGGFYQSEAAARGRHEAAKEDWAGERRDLKRSIRTGSYPLSQAAVEEAHSKARRRVDDALRLKQMLLSTSADAVGERQSGGGDDGDPAPPPLPYHRRMGADGGLPQIRPTMWDQQPGGGADGPKASSTGPHQGDGEGTQRAFFHPQMQRAPAQRNTSNSRYVTFADDVVVEEQTTSLATVEDDDDDLVLDPVHDQQLFGASVGSTQLSPFASTAMATSNAEEAASNRITGKQNLLKREENPHKYFGDEINPIRAAAAASRISPDIVDLVSEEFATMKKKEIERRQRILYELTHPIPTDYTYNGKLVPPPPISFGKVTEEAMVLGEKMMTSKPYRLVRQAKSTDYFFELNELYMEIVMIGRANAGKSSLINALLNQNVAKTSSLPNSTRGVNFYQSVTPEEVKKFVGRDPSKLVKLPAGGLQLTFVDLPGFGITGMSDKWRDNAIQATDSYLGVRRSVNTVFMCMDASKGLTHIDRRYLEWIENLHGTFYIVLTKCDAVPHKKLCDVIRSIYQLITDRQRTTKSERKKGYKSVFPYVIPVSAKTGHNMDLLRGLIVETSGMISGGKLREVLHRKMEQRNITAERDELQRIAEARAIEKEIAAEEYRMLRLEEGGLERGAHNPNDADGADQQYSGDAVASSSSSPSASSAALPQAPAQATEVQLNPDIINKILSTAPSKGRFMAKTDYGDAEGDATSGGPDAAGDNGGGGPNFSSEFANKYNLGVKPLPSMLRYNSVTGEIEEAPMPSPGDNLAMMGGGDGHSESSNPMATAYANTFTGEDLDDLSAASASDDAAAAGAKVAPSRKITMDMLTRMGGAAGDLPKPENTSSVIGLGSDAELFSTAGGNAPIATKDLPRTPSGAVIHSHEGSVSRYLDKLEAYTAALQAKEERGAVGDDGGGCEGGEGEDAAPTPAWKLRRDQARAQMLKSAKVFIEERPSAARASSSPRRKKDGSSRLVSGGIAEVSQWVTTKESGASSGASSSSHNGGGGGGSYRGTIRRRFTKLLDKGRRGDGKGGPRTQEHDDAIRKRDENVRTGRVLSAAQEEAMQRSVLRPYHGTKPLADAAVHLEKGGRGGGGGISRVAIDAAATRSTLLAHESLRKSPNAPWRGLDGMGSGGGGVMGLQGLPSSPDDADAPRNNGGGDKRDLIDFAKTENQRRPSRNVNLSSATKAIWASDESTAAMARLHALEEEREKSSADVFGYESAGYNNTTSPMGSSSSSSSSSSRRHVTSRLAEEDRNMGGSKEHRLKIKALMEERGPVRESLGSMQRRLEKDHAIRMSKTELDWYRKTSGKTVQDYDLFHGETKIKTYMNNPNVAKTIYEQEKRQMGSESRISYNAQTAGMMKKYGRKNSHVKTPGVKGVPMR